MTWLYGFALTQILDSKFSLIFQSSAIKICSKLCTISWFWNEIIQKQSYSITMVTQGTNKIYADVYDVKSLEECGLGIQSAIMVAP